MNSGCADDDNSEFMQILLRSSTIAAQIIYISHSPDIYVFWVHVI